MASAESFSIVEYYAENEGYKCGYCKSPNTNYSHGMWAHNLTVHDYQELIDRGWRRSGSYCYKPTLNITCCPMYTIKCAALDFKLSKSQKKVLKRVNRFLAHGMQKLDKLQNDTNETEEESINTDCNDREIPHFRKKLLHAAGNSENAKINSTDALSNVQEEENETEDAVSTNISTQSTSYSNISKLADSCSPKLPRKVPRPGDGPDKSLPTCKKAKLLRKERKLKKAGDVSAESSHSPQQVGKSLEDFLDECLTDDPKHRLEIRLVRSCPSSREFEATFKTALDVYCRYQVAVHKDPPEKCNERQFTRFLVSSPLEPCHPTDGPPQGYGSFHQQYWLDGKLIAVGVIDILPKCVSSVYFFYDPDYSFLTLGTYGSLRELSFTRSLHHAAPALSFYYMGFYIHSCPKMRYKGSLSPSYLACPEVYTWHPIQECIPLLEKKKFCRFNSDPQARDSNLVTSINEVLILWHHSAMPYRVYRKRSNKSDDAAEILQYAQLVGKLCSRRMLLVRA